MRGKILTIGVDRVIAAYECPPCGLVSNNADCPKLCPRCLRPMKPLYKEVPQRVAV